MQCHTSTRVVISSLLLCCLVPQAYVSLVLLTLLKCNAVRMVGLPSTSMSARQPSNLKPRTACRCAPYLTDVRCDLRNFLKGRHACDSTSIAFAIFVEGVSTHLWSIVGLLEQIC